MNAVLQGHSPQAKKADNSKQSQFGTDPKKSASVTKKELTTGDLGAFASSFITQEIISQADIYRVDSEVGANLIGQSKKANHEDFSGIIFTYHVPGEDHQREYRLRRDNPPLEQKTDGVLKESGKYLTPVGRNNMFYFAPNCNPEWLSASSIPIIFTEGEKKTLALYRASWCGLTGSAETPRFVPIGLTGVWNFLGKNGKAVNDHGKNVSVKGLIPDFNLIEWRNRTVYILFDANVATNPSVAAARRQLAKKLKELKAMPLFIDLPEVESCNGIDDVLGYFERTESESVSLALSITCSI